MELLDRYLQAVGTYLPRKRRDDIIAELRANILEQAEDKASELGRPLTLDEEETLLKHIGRPLLVATRYLPQQHLIGPAVFPYYLFALKTLIPLVLLVYTIANALVFISEPVTASRIIGIMLRFPGIAINVAVWITAIAAVVEFTQTRFLKNVDCDWSPRNLPPLEPKAVYKRSHNIFEVIFGGLFILWLLAIRQNPFLLLGPGAATLKYIQPAAVWHYAYWAFVAVMAAQWAIEIACLVRPGWRRVRPALGLVGKGVAAAVFWFLLRAPQLFTLTPAGRDSAQFPGLVENLNRGVTIGLRVAIIFFVLLVVWEVVRMIFGDPRSSVTAIGKHAAF